MSRRIRYRGWSAEAGSGNGGSGDFAAGEHAGTVSTPDGLVFGTPVGVRSYADPYVDSAHHGAADSAHQGAADRAHPAAPVRYERATWTSPQVLTGFAATELIASWNARTPPGSWLEVAACVVLDDDPDPASGVDAGSGGDWFVLGRWAETDQDIHPTSVSDQDDDRVQVSYDILAAVAPRSIRGYRLRVELLRRPGTPGPVVTHLGAMTSRVPQKADEVPAGHAPRDPAPGRILDVPTYSQQLHRGEYPQWDNGGESWCSPTSTTMVLGYWGRGPAPEEYAWVDPALRDRVIDHAARHTFDHNYAGAGNWSFNTAYAARYGVRAYVTRLRGLAEAERFIAAGIPLVATVAFTREQMTGAGYDTTGHLLTIVGFDDAGNVVSNDPASHGIPSNDEVRTTYDRGQFERAWLTSGGVVYVIHPPDAALPEPPAEANW